MSLAELLQRCIPVDSAFKLNHIDPLLKKALKACRDHYAHADAKELVPLSELVQSNLEVLEGDEAGYKDRLLPFVVDWFKSNFFKWFETPTCEKCSSHLDHEGACLNMEQKVVENYCCSRSDCNYKFQFIRHDDPAILLRTRTGRCGEWAMCFLVILRSLDYDTRIIYDSTDHVWNEVWSEPEKRWMHVDPCESIVDSPLIYEVGWGKKLQYCLAIGQYELLDVTRRYSVDYNETLKRRNLCDEGWLRNCLDTMTEDLLESAPSEEIRLKVKSKRLVDIQHLAALALKPQTIPNKSEFPGRKTGSIQWRIQRGEYSISQKNLFIIEAKSDIISKASQESEEPIFNISYNCDKNLYESSQKEYNSSGWPSLVYEYQNLDFKYERDWKTSYLARYESCPASKVGLIRWRLDLSTLGDNHECWQRIELKIGGKEYPNTSLKVSLICYESTESQDKIQEVQIELNVLVKIRRDTLKSETKVIDIVAILSGGDEHDEVAWQKPQLFRQTRSQNADKPEFDLKIY